MLRVYRYIYYRIYAWNLGMWGEHDGPQFNTCIALAVLSGVNLVSLLLLAGRPQLPHVRAVAILVFGASLLAHYLYFVRGGRYLTLEDEFHVRPPLSGRAGVVAVWAYVGGSLGLFFYLLNVVPIPHAA